MKQTFASNTFASDTFDSGTWTGVGQAVVIVAQIAKLTDIYSPTFALTGESFAQPLKGDYATIGAITGETATGLATGSIAVVAIKGQFGG